MTYQRPLVCCAAFILRIALCSQSFAQKTEKKPAQSNVAYFAGAVSGACKKFLNRRRAQPPSLGHIFNDFPAPGAFALLP